LHKEIPSVDCTQVTLGLNAPFGETLSVFAEQRGVSDKSSLSEELCDAERPTLNPQLAKPNCSLPRCSRNFQTSASRCQEEQSFVLEDGKVLAQTGASQNAVCFWPESATYDICDICERSVPGRGMLGVYPAGMKLCSWCEGAEWQVNICETCVSNMFKTLRSNKVT